MERSKKTKIILSVALAVLLVGVAVFSALAFADLQREATTITARGGSGVDFLGVALGNAMVVMMSVTLAVAFVDIYISLSYLLTRGTDRSKVKAVLNKISLCASVLSLFSVVMCFVTQNDIPLLFGLLWTVVWPIYRLVYAVYAACH